MIGEVEGNEVSSRYGVSVRQRVENSSASLLKQEVNMSNQSMQMYSTCIYIYIYIHTDSFGDVSTHIDSI